MSRRVTGWLMAAGALVLIGCILFGGVMMVLKWDFSKLGTVKWETNRYEISEEFHDISIKTDTADILFAPSDDGRCRVVCYEEEKAKHAVLVQDGALTIHVASEKKWYDYIGITFKTPTITVYLPEAAYGGLSVTESTGDIAIPKDFAFESMDISTSTGDVKNSASVSAAMKIKASTGDIRVQDVSVDALDLSVSTGDVIAKGITCAGDVTVSVSTGKTRLTDVQCGKLISTGSTGDLTMTNVIATETFSIERTTGDVRFDGCDAADILVKTSTGDITGRFLSDKIFVVQTDTGRVDVPETLTGGRCKVVASTGDIILSVG